MDARRAEDEIIPLCSPRKETDEIVEKVPDEYYR
jgi:predicted GNAT family acetyltransferase